MIRATARLFVALSIFTAAAPAVAAESSEPSAASTPIVAAAPAIEPAFDAPWMRDGQPRNGKGLNLLMGSYGVLQGLDMYSTVVARNAGAVEANPLMDTGYGQAAALKAATSVVTYFAARAIARKNKKAAVVTMFILNGVTGAVVLNNMNNARRLNAARR